MKETQSSGGRPPVVPPQAVGLGGAGGEDDRFIDQFQAYVDVLRIASAHVPPVNSVEAEEALGALEALMAEASPETRELAIRELHRQRADLLEQLELERLVARPPRKDYELILPEDDRPAAIERALGLIETILKAIDKN